MDVDADIGMIGLRKTDEGTAYVIPIFGSLYFEFIRTPDQYCFTPISLHPRDRTQFAEVRAFDRTGYARLQTLGERVLEIWSKYSNRKAGQTDLVMDDAEAEDKLIIREFAELCGYIIRRSTMIQ